MLRSSLALIFFPALGLVAQDLPEQSPRVSSYRMEVELDPETRSVTGSQVITWRNDKTAPTSELHFHLYLNAFRDLQSTFMRESDDRFRSQWRESDFGSVEFNSLQLETPGGRVDLVTRIAAPDDGNESDATVLIASLPAPVAPGASITLHSTFVSRMPKAYRRTGWIPENGFFCMHWFPKLGVLEQLGDQVAWNCHQFHNNTEFFADFSTYDVSIRVPDNYVVGASGELQSEQQRDGKKLLRFLAEDVHDFAFVADPDFRVHEEVFPGFIAANDPTGVAPAVAARLGRPVADFNLPETKIILLLHPQHDNEEQVRRHMHATRLALEFYGLRFGPYPYSTVTAVDPGSDMLGRRLGGGMEYPTIFTCGTLLYPHPRVSRPEGVTVHEFGHQYWYGLSANNEFEESWLDEGLNTYSEGRAQWLELFLRRPAAERPVQSSSYGLLTMASVQDALLPADMGQVGLPIGLLPSSWQGALSSVSFKGTILPSSPLLELLFAQPIASGYREAYFQDGWNDRNRTLNADNPDHMVRNGWEYLSRESYSVNSYTRPATIMRTLERVVGRDKWWAFMRRFHAESRFGHPTTEDFSRLLEAECGPVAASFFRDITAAEAVLDYGIHSVSPSSAQGESKRVVIRRYGNVQAEVKLRFRFAEREEPVYRSIPADDPSPWFEFEFTVDDSGVAYGDLQEVWVDPPEGTPGTGEAFEETCEPAGAYLIDSNLLNNSWQAESDSTPALYRGLRLLMQTQSRLTFAGIIG